MTKGCVYRNSPVFLQCFDDTNTFSYGQRKLYFSSYSGKQMKSVVSEYFTEAI